MKGFDLILPLELNGSFLNPTKPLGSCIFLKGSLNFFEFVFILEVNPFLFLFLMVDLLDFSEKGSRYCAIESFETNKSPHEIDMIINALKRISYTTFSTGSNSFRSLSKRYNPALSLPIIFNLSKMVLAIASSSNCSDTYHCIKL